MPGNTVSVFYQTLVTELTKASMLLAPTWHLADSIFWDYRPDQAALGQTLNVPLPIDPTVQVVDNGANDIALSDINFTTNPIVFNRHAYFGYVVRDFEQFNSPESVRRTFVDAAMKGIHNYINQQIVNQIVLANFPTNTWDTTAKHFNATANKAFYPVTGASGKCLTVAEFLYSTATTAGMFARLSDLYVPVQDDPRNMSMVLPSVPYARILDPTTSAMDPAWTQAFIAGTSIAEKAHVTGVTPTVYGMNLKLDQQMPITGSAPTRTFTGIYLHRYAIAAVSRPLPTPDGKVVDYEYVMMKPNPDYASNDVEGSLKLPIRVMVGYNQFPKQGYIVTIDAGFGLLTLRESMAIPFTIAE